MTLEQAINTEGLHRNGETDPPQKSGRYEFFGRRYGHHLGAKNIVVYVAFDGRSLGVMEAYSVGFEHYQGRWWGPYEETVE